MMTLQVSHAQSFAQKNAQFFSPSFFLFRMCRQRNELEIVAGEESEQVLKTWG